MAKIAVIGGGAAGLMAACSAAENGHSVCLLEKNEKLGKKIYITGKGRCNFTNACDFNTFIGNIVSNPKFMYSSLRAFDQAAVTEFFEENGCRTKTERGQRAFPLSDHASDITRSLESFLREHGVRIELNTEVIAVARENVNTNEDLPFGSENDSGCGIFKITARKRNGKRSVYSADRVIISTGGLSYPSTGSTGDGYTFAENFGIAVSDTSPALVPLETDDKNDEHRLLQGVSLKNVKITVFENDNKKPVCESETGEMLFTHFGLSGPLILLASSIISRGVSKGKKYRIEIDLKPGLSEKELDSRILRDFSSASNMNIENAASKLLISSLRPVIIKRAGIERTKKARDITRAERNELVREIKHFSFNICGTRGFDEAIITQGGIKVSELNPKTMEAKKCRGLYFAGEVIDVDAFTGGFNLQIAWSTGHAAGAGL